MWILIVLSIFIISCNGENNSIAKINRVSAGIYSICKENFVSAISVNNETLCPENEKMSFENAINEWESFSEDGLSKYYIKFNLNNRLQLYNHTKAHIGDRFVVTINTIPVFSAVIATPINNGVIELAIDFSILPPGLETEFVKALDSSIDKKASVMALDSMLKIEGLVRVIDVIENAGTTGFLTKLSNKKVDIIIENRLTKGHSLVIEPLDDNDSIIKTYEILISDNKLEINNIKMVTLDTSLVLPKNLKYDLVKFNQCNSKTPTDCLVNYTIKKYDLHKNQNAQIVVLIPSIYYQFDRVKGLYEAASNEKNSLIIALKDNNKINVIGDDSGFQNLIEAKYNNQMNLFALKHNIKYPLLIKWSVSELGKLSADLITDNKQTMSEFTDYYSKILEHHEKITNYSNQVTFTRMGG